MTLFSWKISENRVNRASIEEALLLQLYVFSGNDITVYGDGNQTRCFCDVRDTVRAIVGLCLNEDINAQLYNIGNNEEISIRNLAETINAKTGQRSQIVHIPYSEAYSPGFEDMRRRIPSIERLNASLGWQPQYSLDEILDTILFLIWEGMKCKPVHCHGDDVLAEIFLVRRLQKVEQDLCPEEVDTHGGQSIPGIAGHRLRR